MTLEWRESAGGWQCRRVGVDDSFGTMGIRVWPAVEPGWFTADLDSKYIGTYPGLETAQVAAIDAWRESAIGHWLSEIATALDEIMTLRAINAPS
jgi:hypothetical protein